MTDTTIQILAAQADHGLRQRLKAAAIVAGIPNADYWVDQNIGPLVTTIWSQGTRSHTLAEMWAFAVSEELSAWLRRLGIDAGVTITPGGDIEYYAATVSASLTNRAETPGALVSLYRQAAGADREPGWSSRITDAHLTAAIAAVRAAPVTWSTRAQNHPPARRLGGVFALGGDSNRPPCVQRRRRTPRWHSCCRLRRTVEVGGELHAR